MWTGTGTAISLLASAFKDVAFMDVRLAMVSDADVVLAPRPPAAARVRRDRRDGGRCESTTGYPAIGLFWLRVRADGPSGWEVSDERMGPLSIKTQAREADPERGDFHKSKEAGR